MQANKFDEVLWRIRYAGQLKRVLGLKMGMALHSARAALENLDYDTSVSAIDAADEEALEWQSGSEGWGKTQ